MVKQILWNNYGGTDTVEHREQSKKQKKAGDSMAGVQIAQCGVWCV